MRLSILLIVTTMASVSAAQTPAASDQPAAAAANAENGKKIFASYGCYQCHNYAAIDGMAGPRLAGRLMAFQAFTRYVRKPAGEMPPYTAKVVSDKELADIYAFLRAIPAPPSVDSILILKP